MNALDGSMFLHRRRRTPPGTPLGDLRWARGLTQYELGQLLFGEPEQYFNEFQSRISQIERGVGRVSHEETSKLCKILDVTPQRMSVLLIIPGGKCQANVEGATMENDVLTIPPARVTRTVEGRELEQVIAACIWNFAGGKPNEVKKIANADVHKLLMDEGYSVRPTSIRTAIVGLMKSRRLSVVRDCASEHETRIYKTTDSLRTFAGIAAAGNPLSTGKTIAQLSGEDAPIIAFAVRGPAALPLPEAPMTTEEFAPPPPPPALAQSFDDLLLDLLSRASSAKAAVAAVAEATANCEAAIIQRDKAVAERDTSIGERAMLTAQLAAQEAETVLGGRQRHALKKGAYILAQVLQQMENAMLAAMFETLNVKRDDLLESLETIENLSSKQATD